MTRNSEYTLYVQSLEWRKTSNNVLSATGNRCVLYPWKKATHAHHLHYRNLRNEQVIRDCVPLSPEAHKLIHQDRFWNLNKDSRTPSRLRPFVSGYLRVTTACLMILNPLLKFIRQ